MTFDFALPWQAPVQPAGPELEDDCPEIPRQKEPRPSATMKSPRSSFLLWDDDLPKGVPCGPNRSMHEHGRARLNVFLMEVLKAPKDLQTEVDRRREERTKSLFRSTTRRSK